MADDKASDIGVTFSHMKTASDVGGAVIRLSIFGALLLHIHSKLMASQALANSEIYTLVALAVVFVPIWIVVFFTIFNFFIHLVLEPLFGHPLGKASERLNEKMLQKGFGTGLATLVTLIIAFVLIVGPAALLVGLFLNVSAEMLMFFNGI